MSETKFTPGPYFVGAQNDALFIVAGRAPAPNNDYPWHDAPRVALAKLFGPTEGDCLPVDATSNGALFAAAPELYEALELLALNIVQAFPGMKNLGPITKADAALAKARGDA